jgi:glutathione S-transferase
LGKQLTTVDFHVLVALRWAQRVQPALVEARPRLRALFDTLRDMPFYRTAFAAN